MRLRNPATTLSKLFQAYFCSENLRAKTRLIRAMSPTQAHRCHIRGTPIFARSRTRLPWLGRAHIRILRRRGRPESTVSCHRRHVKPLRIAQKRLPKGRSQFPENPYEYCFIISIIVSELRLSTLTSTSSGNVASRLAYIPYVTKLFDEAFNGS